MVRRCPNIRSKSIYVCLVIKFKPRHWNGGGGEGACRGLTALSVVLQVWIPLKGYLANSADPDACV